MPDPTPFKVLWLQAGSCGGCTMSLLCAGPGDLLTGLEAAGIEFLWHPALSEQTGAEARAILGAVAEGEQPLDALVVEGSVLRGPNGTGRFQMLGGTGRSMADWIDCLAPRARYVVAAGSCAAFGGFPAAEGSPLEACGLQYLDERAGGLLGRRFRSGADLPVINLPGCAPNPEWLAETLMGLAGGDLAERDLDAMGRPRAFFSQLAHHGCPRNEYYEFKASAEHLSEQGCLMENLGCKGTQALGDCNVRQWNGSGSCIRGGFSCIACTSPGFQDPGHAFAMTPKVAGIPVGLPVDMPKAWFVALAALSKSATPDRVRTNARSDRILLAPTPGKGRHEPGAE